MDREKIVIEDHVTINNARGGRFRLVPNTNLSPEKAQRYWDKIKELHPRGFVVEVIELEYVDGLGFPGAGNGYYPNCASNAGIGGGFTCLSAKSGDGPDTLVLGFGGNWEGLKEGAEFMATYHTLLLAYAKAAGYPHVPGLNLPTELYESEVAPMNDMGGDKHGFGEYPFSLLIEQ